MNCAQHPETSAVAFCRECGVPLCEECRRPAMGSIWCAQHLPVAAPPPPPPPPHTPVGEPPSPYTAPMAPPAARVHDANPVLALILGFIPGVGAIYNGQYAKGLIHAVIFGLLVSIVSNSRTGSLEPLFGILIGIWVFYMAFEAFHTARKRRLGVPAEEFSSLLDVPAQAHNRVSGAIVLIAIGFILLLDTTDIINMDQLERYWPVGLIALGLYLLYTRVGAAHPREDRHRMETRQ